jgi:hypothetical protein
VATTEEGADALEELLPMLRRDLKRRGAIAVHGDRDTDFVAALCAANLHEWRGVNPTDSLAAAVAPLVLLGAIVAAIGLLRRSQLIGLVGLAIAASGLLWALFLWIADTLAGAWLVALAPVLALLAGWALYAKLLGFAWGELQRFVDARVSQ